MWLALDEARRGLGLTSPNPPVGCVIVDESHRLLSTGYHKKAGSPHAEVEALDKINEMHRLVGATVYVTLEPCAHQGRTPPCAQTLSRLPIKKVVYGMEDPNPLVSGKGLALLNKSGITTERFSNLRNELEGLAEIFVYNMKNQLSYWAVKVASSLDGKIAFKSGPRQYITSESARKHSHSFRGLYDAVMIGRTTFERDNPILDVRFGDRAGKQNKVLVLDPKAESLFRLKESQLVKVRPIADVIWVVLKGQSPESAPCPVWEVGGSEMEMDLFELKQRCFRESIMSVFVEGGGHLISCCLKSEVIQKWHQYIAPIFMGDIQGLSLTPGLNVLNKSLAPKLDRIHVENIGSELLLTGNFS